MEAGGKNYGIIRSRNQLQPEVRETATAAAIVLVDQKSAFRIRTPLTLTPPVESLDQQHMRSASDAFESKYHPLLPLPSSPLSETRLYVEAEGRPRLLPLLLHPNCPFLPFLFSQFVPYLRRHARYNGRMMLFVAWRLDST